MFNKIFSIIAILFLSTLISAQPKQKISVEWIYSNESSQITRLPNYAWTENGVALIYDSKKSENVIYSIDPVTGKENVILDLDKAIQNLKEYLLDDTPKILRMPESFDKAGNLALYNFKNDIFVLDIKTSKFIRVTNTHEEEKNAKFSPDGNRLAFVRSNNIYVFDLNTKTEKQITSDGSSTILNGTLSWVYWEEVFGRNDEAFWWSPDSKSIAYLQTDESQVSTMYFQDFRPFVPDVIEQKYPKTGEKNPMVKVGVVAVENSNTSWLNFKDYPYEYIIRVKWLPNSRQVSVQTMNRNQDTLKLFFAEPSNGKVKHILTETDQGWVNVNDDLTFIENRKQFLWVSERSGYAHIYRYDINGNLINQVTKGDWAVSSSGGSAYWVRGAISEVDQKNKIIYFTSQEKNPIEKHLYKINYDGSGLSRLTTGDFTHRISFSPNADYLFDTYSNISTPPVLSLFKSNGQLVKQIASFDKEKLENLELQRPEIFYIKAKDGFDLPAEIMKPKDFDKNKKYPLILYVYGGPSAPQVQNNWRNSIYYDQVLLDNGYLVGIIDPRTATAISKNIENLLLKNMGGEIELRDLVDAVKWFKNQSYIDSTRIGVWGWSGGGTFTLNAMTNSNEFKAGIAVAAVTDWHYYDTKFGEMAMKTPQLNPDGYLKTSLVKNAKNLSGRLMIVHGTYDDNVHPQNAYAFIDELIKVNKMFDMMFYPMRKHGISDRPARIHLYNKMLEFWKNNL